MLKWQKERELVLEAARNMVERGLVIGKAGNVSLRLTPADGRELMVITPTSRYYESLAAGDIPVVDFEGGQVEGMLPPSSEVMLHARIYQARKAVTAVMHTHSTYASAVAVAGLRLPALLEEEVAFLGGEVEVAPYAASGSLDLAENAVAALGDRNAVMLANHGAVGVGRSLREALDACELLEKASKIFLITLALGKANALPPDAAKAARDLFRRLQSSEDR